MLILHALLWLEYEYFIGSLCHIYCCFWHDLHQISEVGENNLGRGELRNMRWLRPMLISWWYKSLEPLDQRLIFHHSCRIASLNVSSSCNKHTIMYYLENVSNTWPMSCIRPATQLHLVQGTIWLIVWNWPAPQVYHDSKHMVSLLFSGTFYIWRTHEVT